MPQVRTLILRAPGSNCDAEAQFAFELAGAAAERVHVNRLRENPPLLQQYQILCIPGGFTYGDDVAAGRILAVQLRSFLNEELQRFRDAGKLILGICNGFQVLLKAGLLIDPVKEERRATSAGRGSKSEPREADRVLPATLTSSTLVPATLTHNSSGKFEDRWIRLKASGGNCPFLWGYDYLEAPIAHGEGRFLCRTPDTLAELERRGQIVLRYVGAGGEPGPYPVNPNGSQADVAGVCDPSGRVLGLMPHPERHTLPTHHPHWTRRGMADEPDGVRLFRNAVRFVE